MVTRLRRAEQGERNRASVLAAAREVFLRRGYAGATLDAIAEAAGFSKGVVYSQFAGKPDLFLALLEQRIAERAAENDQIAATAAGLDGMRELLAANARHADRDGGWPQLLVEFRVVAAGDPELNARYAALHTRTHEHFTEAISAVLTRGGLAPVFPPAVFAELILTIDAGRVLERAAGRGLDTDVLLSLLGRIVAPV